jgi:beta-glucosidase
VVQLYVRSLNARVERPFKELRAFAKLKLDPGSTGTAVLKIAPRDLAYFDVEAGRFRADAGKYELIVAASATDVRASVSIHLPVDHVMEP